MNIKALLLDLDGTLLNIDMRSFIPQYIAALAPYLSHLIPEKEFGPMLLQSTQDMIENTDDSQTNEEVFYNSFCSRSGYSANILTPIFEEFYRIAFPKLKNLATSNPEARILLNKALEQNFALIIATNPVFPRIAIEHRLNWADLNNFTFKLVTTLENMHFCKPRLEYYEEILKQTNYNPNECLMVGNDTGEDMIAGKLGIKTFLVENEFLIARPGKNYPSHYRGSLSNLIEMISL